MDGSIMPNEISIVSLVAHATVPVQIILLLLLAASVFSWYLMFLKRGELRAAKGRLGAFEQRFWSGIELGDLYRELRVRGNTEGIEGVFGAGFQEFLRLRQQESVDQETVTDAARRAMDAAQAREMQRLEDRLTWLATIGSASPYVGLFGTVWGIMNAFMSLSGVQQATLAMVAPGIAEALIATAFGLFAAIPAVVAYNRFSSAIDHLEGRYDSFRDEFTNILQRSAAGPRAERRAQQ